MKEKMKNLLPMAQTAAKPSFGPLFIATAHSLGCFASKIPKGEQIQKLVRKKMKKKKYLLPINDDLADIWAHQEQCVKENRTCSFISLRLWFVWQIDQVTT